MKKVRNVFLFSMGLALVALTGLCAAQAAAPDDTAAAAVTAPADTASEAITAAGKPSEWDHKDEPSCSCACSPLAGAWIATLSQTKEYPDAIEITSSKDGKDGKDGKDVDGKAKKARPLLQTFKFVPVNTECDKFVVNAQAITRPQRVVRGFAEVTDLTELVGIACQAKSTEVRFTAIGYGVERTVEYDKTILIVVVSGTIELPDGKSHDGKYNVDSAKQGKDDGKNQDRQECDEPEKLCAELTVEYFDAEQDEDGDGFPDSRAEPIVCLTFNAEFKRVPLLSPYEPAKKAPVPTGKG
jgi:hypothetical protein